MIHFAICDDEQYMSDKIKEMISDFFHNRNIEISISRFSSGEELLLYDRKIDILFCEIIDRKVYLHLKSGDVIDYYDKMEHLEKKLDHRFFKCHRSFLINLRYLRSYKNGIAYMENGKEIPVSRLRSKEFSNIILRYMQE